MAEVLKVYSSNIIAKEDESNIVTLTRDQVFDMLEEYISELESQQTMLARARAKVDSLSKQTEFYAVQKTLESTNKFWSILANLSDDDFYISRWHRETLDSPRNSTMNKVTTLMEFLMAKGIVTKRYYRLQVTLEKGAKCVAVTEDVPAYLGVKLYAVNSRYTCDVGISKEDVCAEAADINVSCRIFKCKDCGRIDYISKMDDESKKDRGLQPVKRCFSCIQKRRELKEQTRKE